MRCLTQFEADVVGADSAACAVRQEDVLRLQVSVDDAFTPQDAHSTRYLLQEAPDGILTQRASGWKEHGSVRKQQQKLSLCEATAVLGAAAKQSTVHK